MKSQKGVTLIELMVVVAIVAVLAKFAMPAYSNYVIRGKIPDATSNLSSMRVQMEQYYQDNRYYSGTVIGTGSPCNSTSVPAWPPSNYFTFSCPTFTPTTYKIQAQGFGSMNGFTYTIDITNTKTSTIGAAAPAGWANTASTSCWITNTGGQC